MGKTLRLAGLTAPISTPVVMAANDINIEERLDNIGDRVDARLDRMGLASALN